MTKLARRKALATRTRSSRADQIEAKLSRNYLRSQYCFVELLVGHWSDVSRTFGGDLQLALVLAVIGQRELEAAMAGVGTRREPRAKRYIAAARIADVTGIPRETVRRKLVALSKRCWVDHVPGAGWCLRVAEGKSRAGVDLREIDARGRKRLALLLSDLEKLA